MGFSPWIIEIYTMRFWLAYVTFSKLIDSELILVETKLNSCTGQLTFQFSIPLFYLLLCWFRINKKSLVKRMQKLLCKIAKDPV